jgi:riboflavin synthase
MFTGLILGPGRVLAVTPGSATGAGQRETRLEIRPEFAVDQYHLGESIAVNGVCLTVESFSADRFAVFVSAESLRLTNLGALTTGALVNLERALALGERLGGHLVSGHVDCVARVSQMRSVGGSRWFRLSFPEAFGMQVVSKGSVTLDGISLTVNACGSTFLEVNIIPETWRNTTISQWRLGRDVNMETDLIGKYVQRMLGAWTQPKPAQSGMSESFLRKHGF